MRAHFSRPLLDNAGNRIAQATVRILQPGTEVQLVDTLYSDASTGATLPNPFQTGGQDISFYLDVPQRVRIGAIVAGFPEMFWDDIDVLASGTESQHLGTDIHSTQVGTGAAATALHATAVGPGAAATVTDSTAVGAGAQATEQGATAFGAGAFASYTLAVAVGSGSVSSSSSSTAVGANSHAGFGSSTAVGTNAETSRDHQVMLGTNADDVDIPGTLVLVSPDGKRWGLKIGPDGTLAACVLEGLDSLNTGGGSGPGTVTLPIATTTAAGMVELNGVDTNIKALGTQAAGASGLAADAIHVHPMPRLQDILSPTADVAWGGKKITSLANSSAAAHAATAAQLGAGRNHPALFDLLAWTAAPSECTQKYALVSGQVPMILVRPAMDGTVNKLGVFIGQAGATPTGVCGLALYSEAGVLLGQTGDASTAFATLGYQELAMASGVDVSASLNYYLAPLSNMVTAPQVWSPAVAGAAVIPAVRSHRASLLLTGQTAFPATVDTTAATGNNALYCLSMGS